MRQTGPELCAISCRPLPKLCSVPEAFLDLPFGILRFDPEACRILGKSRCDVELLGRPELRYQYLKSLCSFGELTFVSVSPTLVPSAKVRPFRVSGFCRDYAGLTYSPPCSTELLLIQQHHADIVKCDGCPEGVARRLFKNNTCPKQLLGLLVLSEARQRHGDSPGRQLKWIGIPFGLRNLAGQSVVWHGVCRSSEVGVSRTDVALGNCAGVAIVDFRGELCSPVKVFLRLRRTARD